MRCKKCGEACIKNGKQNGVQRYKCKRCNSNRLFTYKRKRYDFQNDTMIQTLNNEGMGISSISRVVGISKSMVQRRIEKIALALKPIKVNEQFQTYEVDELRTFVGNKKREYWITYAINRKTRQIIDFVVGRRTKENLKKVVDKLLVLNPRRIYTDGLNIYRSLIGKDLHRVYKFGTNRIERMNLTLRTHLKRLNRKTICFTRNLSLLEYCLRIYLSK